MTSDKILIKGGTVLTMDPTLGDLTDHDVLVEDDRIAAIAPDISADAEPIDARGKLVLPGFADTHRHTWQTQLRYVGADWTFADYLTRLRGSIGPLYTPEDMYIANLLGGVEALYSGVTTLLDWNHLINTPQHADAAIEGLRDAGLRSVFCHSTGNDGCYPVPSGVQVDAKDARRVRDQWFSSDDGLHTMAYGPLGTELGGESTVVPDFAAARDLGLRISVHVGFFGQWLHQVEFLAKHGLLGPDVTLLHCNATTEHEYQLISRSGAHISISPESEMHLGCGIPPTGRVLRHDMRPSISTDVPSVMGTDMFGQMRSMLGVMRGVQSEAHLAAAGDGPAVLPEHEIRISSHDVLEFATIEGARHNGLDAKTGSITPGKQADLIVISTDAPTLRPLINPAAAVVLGTGPADVEHVLVAGRMVKRDGQLIGHDLAAIGRQAEASAKRLLANADVDPQNFLITP